VLMVGGGEGMGKLEQTVAAIVERGVNCQVRKILVAPSGMLLFKRAFCINGFFFFA
jgi:hypothetical protein